MISYRFIPVDEYDIIAEFIREHWCANHVYLRNKDLFHWTFYHPELFSPDHYCFAIAEEYGKLLGILGGIVVPFTRMGREANGVWLANWVTDPNIRGQGVGSGLLEMFLKDERLGPVFGYSTNDKAARVWLANGFQMLWDMPRFLCFDKRAVDPFVQIIRTCNPMIDDQDLDHLLSITLLDFASMTSDEPGSNALSNDWEQIWDHHFKGRYIGTDRGRRYLEWRYLNHPSFKYRIISLRNSPGLVVYRIEKIRVDNTGNEYNFARIVEFLAADSDAANNLLALLMYELRGHQVIGFDHYNYAGDVAQLMQAAGITHSIMNPVLNLFPSRFNPVEMSSNKTLSAVHIDQPIPDLNNLITSKWYWTKSDGDQDRPN